MKVLTLVLLKSVSTFFTNVTTGTLSLDRWSFEDVITLQATSGPLFLPPYPLQSSPWPHMNGGNMFLQFPNPYCKEREPRWLPKSTLYNAFFIPYCCFLIYGPSRKSAKKKKNLSLYNRPFLISQHLNIMLTQFYGDYCLLLFYVLIIDLLIVPWGLLHKGCN